ncbi:energy-coupling factor transporter transmembrane protein EcfT [Rhodobacteraceae bacterium RKSG542]|uniref:energy-coupling factor transporter transmembrane component T family protein n=1 Tax=Pseudovibrio flavus TaxID=2529854 RepID=UPI0012BC182F|nr:energy-coupling factor transporter transmembrane protein EcfT [Pseudovibrio flavus]MTI16858.1 energy-coupling factor transporter transmembrane protein EcfT [Pseudovibrio flavus]
MTASFYIHKESWLHRLAAGRKLFCLAVLGTGISFVSDLWLLAGALSLCVCLFPAAQLRLVVAYNQVRPLFWIMAALFVAKLFTGPLSDAFVVILRLCILVLAAGLITVTTKTSALLTVLERVLTPLSVFGFSAPRMAFALSLVIRFIPVVGQISQEVREAQQARGLGTNIFALIIPFVLRIVKMAEQVSQAIDARGGLPDAKPSPAVMRRSQAVRRSVSAPMGAETDQPH